MHGICKLCKKESNLELSHFIPKFVGKWVKKTSITGFLREKNEIDKRAQDLAKEYWLCGECEDLFSTWETLFANNVFYPFVDKEQSVSSYGSWLSKFCASLSWRTLTYIRSKNNNENKPEEYYRTLDKAEESLSNFILGKTDNLNQYEQHLFPLERIESTDFSGMSKNINRYFLRIVSMDIIGNSKNLFVYTKLPSFMLIGFINVEKPKLMRTSRIALKSGKLSPRNYHWPDGFIDYIVEKSNEITELSDKISPKQQAKIEEFIKNNPEKAANSKQFEAFLHDYGMFGDDVFKYLGSE
jgi:hypothetical protein